MTQIFNSYLDFIQHNDKKVNGVSQWFADKYPNYEEMNETNEGCWNCIGCIDCIDCSGENKEGLIVPVIENIHQKVLEAVSKPDALNMGTWHTCDTTHCRAGWVVFLAGEQGKELESLTSTAFAAMMIYKKSSDIRVYPPRFFETEKVAMEDIKRCAELEIKTLKKNW